MKNMNKKITLKIMTLVLAIVMVFSLSLVSVSAVPSEYTVADGGYELTDFASNIPTTPKFAIEDAAKSIEYVSDFGHDANGCLRFNGATDSRGSWGRFYFSTGLTLAANTTYYVSFWYYSDDTSYNTTLASQMKPSGSTMSSVGYSGNAKSQWNKIWYTFTTGSTVSNEDADKRFKIGIWGMGDNKCGYIDDIEVAQLSSMSTFENEVPDALNVAASAICNLEGSVNVGSCFAVQNSSAQTRLSVENAFHGEASLKYTSTANSGFYLNVNNTFGTDVAIETGKTYYFSFYVCSPDADITLGSLSITHTIKPFSPITIPAGEWTKVSGLFTVDESTGANSNKHLFKINVSENGDNAVYFDDFVFAKLVNVPTTVSLTEDEVDYNFDLGTAEVTFESSIEITSVIELENITAPEGVTVTDVSLSADGMSVTVSLSGLDENSIYYLTFNNVEDIFERTTSVNTSFNTPTSLEITDVVETIVGVNAKYTRTVTKNTNGTVNAAMIVAAYNVDGELISIGMDINNVVGGTGATPVPFEVTITKGVTYRAIILDWSTFNSIEQ